MLSNHPNCLGGNGPSASSDLIGDVDGPASATDNAVARFDGTTGKLIQNSVVTIADTTGDIAGATSLTSPASTNLTLGLGTGGTALTLAHTTLAATFAGSVAAAGGAGSATDFAFVGANTAYATFDKATAGPAGNAYGIRIGKNGYSSLTIGLNKNTVSGDIPSYAAYIGLYGNDKDLAFADNLDSTPVTRMIIKSGGTVSIASTTAGASNAGALVVQGGISAGNTGAASYFGGSIDSTKTTTSGNYLNVGTTNAESGFTLSRSGAIKWYLANTNSTDNLYIYSTAAGTVLTFAQTTGAATFAGAVTGNSTFSSGVQSTTAGGYKLFDAGGYSVNFRPTAALTYVIEGTASGNDYLTSFTNAGAGKHNLAASGTLAITGAATFAGAVAIGNTVNSVSPTSPNRTVTMVVNGVTLYLAAKTTND